MATSPKFETLLSLDEWAAIMEVSPFEVNQIGKGITYHREAQCETVFYQSSWQMQFISRDEVASAISKAEHALANILNFWPAPKYIRGETIPYPRSTWSSTPDYMTPRGEWKPVKTRYQYIQALGTQSRTLIEADAMFVSTDEDGDGVLDTFTLTVATTETDASILALYYSASDRYTPLSEVWQIRPVQVEISGGNAIFTGALAQITVPELWRKPSPERLDAATPLTTYVDTLDVYKVETDSSNIGTAYWDGYVGQVGTSSGAIDSGTIVNEDELGYFRPQIGLCGLWGYAPTRLSVNYLAGYPRQADGSMSEPFATMVTYLSCAYMPAKKCGCERSDQIFYWWRSFPSDGEEGRRPMIPQEIANCPFPPTRGGIYAWQEALKYMDAGGAMA